MVAIVWYSGGRFRWTIIFGLIFCLLSYIGNGAQHVSDCRKIKKTNEQILWNKIYSIAWLPWATFFHFCGLDVPGEKNTGKKSLGRKAPQAAINKLRLSYYSNQSFNSWFWWICPYVLLRGD